MSLPDSLPSVMKVINVEEPGKHSRLYFTDRPLPVPAYGQLLIRVEAAGINRADLMQRRGLYPPPAGESDIPGLEVAGTVVAAADNEQHWLGQKVFGLVGGGGYAEYALLQANHAMHLPAGWSMVEGAATAEVFLTAFQLLFAIGQLQAGQKVLIHAGASGVGTAAIQLARYAGAEVAVTVSSDEKAQACLALGANLAINYRSQDFAEQISQHWPQGINVVLDPVAGSYLAKEIPLLAMDGIIAVFAMMGGSKMEQIDLAPLFKRRGQLICSTLRNRSTQYKAELVQAFEKQFAGALASGRLKPVIHQVFDWQQAEQAHQLMASNQTMGKLILTLN
ncbi:NAD(P)H-quinone oxidoreductase [Chromatiaceae bacterium AAb-1]|nr:NAD(P)H-quinone oxidoreductase [Chromatiaceae bacterium AAb-1]